jgi:hypothetical protein
MPMDKPPAIFAKRRSTPQSLDPSPEGVKLVMLNFQCKITTTLNEMIIINEFSRQAVRFCHMMKISTQNDEDFPNFSER